MNLWDFEAIDWDDVEDEDGNLVHCRAHGIDEVIVYQVLSENPVEIQMSIKTADFAVVGPDYGRSFWTVLFDWSYKRGDWIRPVTGWKAEPEEIQKWQRATGGRA